MKINNFEKQNLKKKNQRRNEKKMKINNFEKTKFEKAMEK